MTTYDDPHHQQFSDGELAAMVAEAARAERIVAAHCHGKAGILAALRAGVKTIEHGSRTGLPEYARRKLLNTAEDHRRAVALAVEKGVRIASGTDTLTSGDESALPWGLHGMEPSLLVEAVGECRHLAAAGHLACQLQGRLDGIGAGRARELDFLVQASGL